MIFRAPIGRLIGARLTVISTRVQSAEYRVQIGHVDQHSVPQRIHIIIICTLYSELCTLY